MLYHLDTGNVWLKRNMKFKPEVSIIIPCFNCESTLLMTVQSLVQSTSDLSYEVIFVDDGSTDRTSALILDCVRMVPHGRIISHSHNQGGGAARNTGITNAHADVVFCLDSDNLLSNGVLKYMLEFLMKSNLDGVAFHKRKYFWGNAVGVGSTHINPLSSDSYVFTQLFDGSNVLLDNFLMKKSAFHTVGGFTTAHDFDTQEFEMLFLAKGLRVRACPDTVFFHRQRAKNKSYFERVFERGEYSLNYYLILEKVFHLFSHSTQREIIKFDIWKQSSLEDNLLSALMKLYQNNSNSFFEAKNDQYLLPSGATKYYEALHGGKKIEELWGQAIFFVQNGRYAEALLLWLQIGTQQGPSALLQWNIMRTTLHMQQPSEADSVERQSLRLLKNMQLHPQINNLRKPIPQLVLSKIIRFLE